MCDDNGAYEVPSSDPNNMPSDDMKARFLQMMSEGALGIVRLKHRASGEWHVLLVGADSPVPGTTPTMYPYARMFDIENDATDLYEPPPGSHRVNDDGSEIKTQ